MAFVLHAFEHICIDGEIMAILPAGSMGAERGREAWLQLRQHATINVLSQHDHKTFVECFPTTNLVHITRGSVNETDRLAVMSSFKPPLVSKTPVMIQRGTIQMHSVPKGRAPLAHSSDLTQFRLALNGHRAKSDQSSVSGHFVAICRVGNPKKDKVALHFAASEIVISDCIIALRCSSKATAKRLHSGITTQWPKLASLYTGTGARYITVAKVAAFVRNLGFVVEPHANAKSQLRRSIESTAEIASL
jgi:hypothetical protein